MSENDELSPNYPSEKMLDIVFLRATHCHLQTVLRHAKHEVSYFRREICTLATQPELPLDFQTAYGHIETLLSRVEQAIANGVDEGINLHYALNSSGIMHLSEDEKPTSPETVEAAKNVIKLINQVEHHLNDVVTSAKTALVNHAQQGLIDWDMPYNCEFFLIINPGPTRSFYSCCGEVEEPMRIRIGPHRDFSDNSGFNDRTYNWNVCSQDDHPLRNDHHGYLVHEFFDHLYLPWQLMPHIQEIEVKFNFCDYETLWSMPTGKTENDETIHI